MQHHDSKVDSADAIDQAWKEGKYNDVLFYLQRDWLYPDGFQIDKLNEQFEDQKLLKQFVERRTKLHEEIEQGNLKVVKRLTARKESKFYLNSENRSAAFTAIKSKQFRVYAFLKSIGVKLIVLDDEEKAVSYSKRFRRSEKHVLDELSLEEKNNLREIMRLYILSNPVEQLIGKSKIKQSSGALQHKLRTKVKNYYKKILKTVPEILKVVQYEKDLEVNFDFDNSNVSDLCPLDSKQAGGLTISQEKTTYIAGKRKEKEILGTLVHELTHTVMDMIFKNNYKPYTNTDKSGQNEFERIVQNIKLFAEDLRGSEAQIILNVFRCYSPEKYHRELIVRIPQILMEFQNGVTWLEENVKELLEFFILRILPKLEKFINESYLLKPRSLIRSLNENIGEINDIKRCPLFFQNLEALEAFLKRQRISFLISKSTKLTVCRVLQALYQKNYVDSYGNFIVLKFETCIDEFDDIKMAFSSEATDSLVLDCKSVDHTSLEEGIMKLIQELSTTKNIIFVLKENQKDEIEKILDYFIDKVDKFDDSGFCLNDLDEKSRNIILEKNVIFQGKSVSLGTFFEEKEFFKLIDADILAGTWKNKKYDIGKKIFGTSNLNGSYAEIIHPVNTETLITELKTSKDIFIFNGDKDQIIKKSFSWEISDKIAEVDLKSHCVTSKNILLTENNCESHFQKFCQNNPSKKVYLICINFDETFILKQIYNPDFYMARNIRKKVMKFNKKYEIVRKVPETFIISRGNNNENFEIFSNGEKLDVNDARDFMETTMPVHRFRVENNLLLWLNTEHSNRIRNLREFVEDLSTKSLTDENELLKDIVDKKIVILADEPGMGKSTTITKLYESDVIAKNHWIIRINLNNYIDVIKRIKSSNITISTVMHFLEKIESISRNRLSKIIFDLTFRKQNNFSKFSMLIVFDGFDELLDEEDRNKIIHLLKVLKNETKCKVWITTRPHYKVQLENELQTFALQIDPINDISSFIKKYYMDRLNLILTEEKYNKTFNDENGDTKLSVYVEEFTRKMKFIFKENISTILGTPLQLSLMMYNSIEHFRNWLENEKSVLNFSYLGNNILEVFECYIDRRYEIYFKKTFTEQKLHQKLIKEQLERCHEEIAFYTHKNVKKRVKKYKTLVLLLGTVQLHNNDLQFFHFTFEEYYRTIHFVKILKNRINSDHVFAEIVKTYIMGVLSLPGHQLIRKFIDLQLGKIDFNKIPRKNLRLFAETFFLLWKKCRSKRDMWKPQASLFNASFENNENLFYFIFFTLILYCKPWNYSRIMLLMWKNCEDNQGNFTLLHTAAEITTENSKIWNILLETMDKMSLEKQKKVITAEAFDENINVLHSAVENLNLFAMRILLEKAKMLLTAEELLEFFINIRFDEMNERKQPEYSQMITAIFREAEKVLSANHHRQFLDALSRDYDFYQENKDLVYKLFQEIEKVFENIEFFEIFTRKLEGDISLIHVLADDNHYKVLELLYEKYKKEKWKLPDRLSLYNILMITESSRNKTVLRTAVERYVVDFSNLLIKIAKEEFLPNQQLNFIREARRSGRTNMRIIEEHIDNQLRPIIDDLRLNLNDF